jgi:chemotaxis methyl-accepting protein methylase
MKAAMTAVAELVHAESGMLLKESQYPALRKAVARIVGSPDASAFLRLASDPFEGPQALDRLIDETTIQETYFLRERDQLESIDWRLALEGAAGTLQVWDAACATGEEAYSLALLAMEALGFPAPPVRVLATDISRGALERAREATYGARSLRDVEPRLRERHFQERSGSFEVHERLRRLVSFARHNLVRDAIPPRGEGPFDLIVCRNILIYFDAPTAARLVEQFEGALRPGGMLVLGAADVLCITGPRLERLTASPRARPARRLVPRRERKPPPQTGELLSDEQHFVRGLADLEAKRFDEAVVSFRRSLYLTPSFGLAAFQLGRAHEASGDPAAARRAYAQALRTIDVGDERHDHILDQVDLTDVAAACRARLAALA